jgi:hypothetical protein
MDAEATPGQRFIIWLHGGRYHVQEVLSDGSRVEVQCFVSESAAVALRRDLQAKADRVAFIMSPAPPPPKPSPGRQDRKRDRKRERARRMQRMAALGVAALVAMATPGIAQHSQVYLCLQRTPGTFSVDQMLDTCQAQIRDWLETCTRQRDIANCAKAIVEEADISSQQKRQP